MAIGGGVANGLLNDQRGDGFSRDVGLAGVDIGAIEFIRKRIIDMRDAGKAIILISVELEEIMSLSDRIVVMCDGEITGTVDGSDADEATLGMMMANALESEDISKGVKL